MFRTTAAACAALTTAMLPVFLVGALSDHLRRDLGIDETGIGAALTALFLVAAVAAPVAGRVAERFGAATALRSGVVLAGALAGTVAAFASGWWLLALPLAAVGIAVGLVDTGAARAFADRVPDDRLGRVFGVKEASVPAASLLAGLAVPTLAVQVGWRSTFVATLAVAALVLVLIPRDHRLEAGPPAAAGDGPSAAVTAAAVGTATHGGVSAAMVAFAAAVGLGAGAATAAATFLVPAMTSRGFTPAAAGLVLSAASVVSIAARIVLGRVADRPATQPVPVVAGCCLAGAVAAAVLATSVPGAVAIAAALVVLGAGWGWTGLAFLSAVRVQPRTPAVAAGVVLSGLGAGGALAPLVFGALAGRVSYAVAWAVVATAFLVAAILVAALRRRLAAAPTPV